MIASVNLLCTFIQYFRMLWRRANAPSIRNTMHSLNDLVESFHLYAECERCQRSVQLDIEKLIVRLGGDFPITGVRDRLRCTSCNIRSQDVRIVFVGPPGKRVIFQYRR